MFSFYATKHMTTGEGGFSALTIKQFLQYQNHSEIME